MGIFEKRFERKPEASCFETNLLFLDLQTLHKDLTNYFLFFVTNPFELIFFVFRLHLRQ